MTLFLLVFTTCFAFADEPEIIDGIKREYYESGKLKSETAYKGGKENGVAKQYYESGKLMGEGTFKDGNRIGIVKSYYESGELHGEVAFDDKGNGDFKQYYRSGKLLGEGPFKAGKKNGLFKSYYESGELSSETPFIDDNKNGVEKLYYKPGGLSREVPFKEGKANGVVKKYYELSGKLMSEQTFKDGKGDGFFKEYYKSGKLKMEVPFKDGKVSGVNKIYYESGNLEREVSYTAGKINGWWKEYYISGELRREAIWQDGDKKLSDACYDISGNKIDCLIITKEFTERYFGETQNFKNNYLEESIYLSELRVGNIDKAQELFWQRIEAINKEFIESTNSHRLSLQSPITDEERARVKKDMAYFKSSAQSDKILAYSELFMEASKAGQYDFFVTISNEALEKEESDEVRSSILFNRGIMWQKRAEYEKALVDYSKSVDLNTHLESLSLLAQLLASCPEDQYRDGKKAIEYAKKAIEIQGEENVGNLGILAAAYAENNNFQDAIATQKKAFDDSMKYFDGWISESKSESEKEKARKIKEKQQAIHEKLLELYKAGKPYRMKPPKAE